MIWTEEDDEKMFKKWWSQWGGDEDFFLDDNDDFFNDIYIAAKAAWKARGIYLEDTIRKFMEVK